MTACALTINARYHEFKGQSVILEQPEGTLRHYDATAEGIYIDTVNNETVSFRLQYKMSIVTGEDGKVYVKCLLGTPDDGYPTWVEGEMTDGNILLNPGDIFRFNFGGASAEISGRYQFMYGPAKSDLTVAKIDSREDVLELVPVSADKIILSPTENEGYKIEMTDNTGIILYPQAEKKKILTKIELTPSEEGYIYPPEGYEIEDYQINFIPFSCLVNNTGKASQRLKVVNTGSEIYIKGLGIRYKTWNDPEAWIKGEIQGDRVVFKNRLQYGYAPGGQPLYLASMGKTYKYDEDQVSEKLRKNGIRNEINIRQLEQDLSFAYDPETGNLSQPSSDFGLLYFDNQAFWFSYSTEDMYGWPDYEFYRNAEIIKIDTETPYKPRMPLLTNQNATISLSYLDIRGRMMDPMNLYLVFVKDGVEPNLDFERFDAWEDLEDVISVWFLYLTNTLNLNWVGTNLTDDLRQQVSKEKIKNAILVYYGDDYVVTSANADTAVEEVEAELPGDGRIYDLFGRIVNEESLLPGTIYIKDGKKFMK